MDKTELWKNARPYIIKAINSEVAFNTYLKDAVVVSYESNVFTLGVSFPTKKNIITIKYKKIIEDCLSKITGQPVRLNVIIGNSSSSSVSNIPQEPEILPDEDLSDDLISKMRKSNLNERYTLENFVVGKSNSYAFAAAENVVNFPAQNNNPLFIYGKSGLGKTHLMQAIGNEILKRNPHMNVLYVTSEQFTIDMITFLKEKNMEEFRRQYRDVDVLLVDDVQFINTSGVTLDLIRSFLCGTRSLIKRIAIACTDLLSRSVCTAARQTGNKHIDQIQQAYDLTTQIVDCRGKCVDDRCSHSTQTVLEIKGVRCNTVHADSELTAHQIAVLVKVIYTFL